MADRIKRIVCVASESTTDVHGGGGANAMGSRGAGDAKFLLVGYAPDSAGVFSGVYRSYVYFPLDNAVADDVPGGWSGVKTLKGAYVKVFTRDERPGDEVSSNVWDRSIFEASADSVARIHRLRTEPAFTSQGNGYVPDPFTPPMPQAHWDSDDHTGLTKSDWDTDEFWEDNVNPNEDASTIIRCLKLVAMWAPSKAGGHKIYWDDPDEGGTALKRTGNPNQWDGTFAGYDNDGIVIKTPREVEGSGSLRFELHSTRAVAAKRPRLIVEYVPWNQQPDPPGIIGPRGGVSPHFEFTGVLDETPDDPIKYVSIESEQTAGGDAWSTKVMRAADWPAGRYRIPNPRQPDIPAEVQMHHRVQSETEGGTVSEWSEWRTFTVRRRSPTVTPTPMGERSTMVGQRLAAEWTI